MLLTIHFVPIIFSFFYDIMMQCFNAHLRSSQQRAFCIHLSSPGPTVLQNLKQSLWPLHFLRLFIWRCANQPTFFLDGFLFSVHSLSTLCIISIPSQTVGEVKGWSALRPHFTPLLLYNDAVCSLRKRKGPAVTALPSPLSPKPLSCYSVTKGTQDHCPALGPVRVNMKHMGPKGFEFQINKCIQCKCCQIKLSFLKFHLLSLGVFSTSLNLKYFIMKFTQINDLCED